MEGRSVRPLTLWMLYMVLQERFELITDLNLNQVPLPIGLLEQSWLRRAESNCRHEAYETPVLPLNYLAIIWSVYEDSNLGPNAPKAIALPD